MNKILVIILFFGVHPLLAMRHNPYQTRKFRNKVTEIKQQKNAALIAFLNSLRNFFPRLDIFKNQIKLFILNGANPNCANELGISALMIAGSNGLTDLTEFLLQKGANPSQLDRFGMNALMCVLRKAEVSEEILKLLIESKININHCDGTGTDALSLAVVFEHPEAVDLLITQGANPEKKINGKNAYELTASKINTPSHWNSTQTAKVSSFLSDFSPNSKSKIP